MKPMSKTNEMSDYEKIFKKSVPKLDDIETSKPTNMKYSRPPSKEKT